MALLGLCLAPGCYEGYERAELAALDSETGTAAAPEGDEDSSRPGRADDDGADAAERDDEGNVLPGAAVATAGCTDVSSPNYDSTATSDDGSCIFPGECDEWLPLDFDDELSNYGNDPRQTLEGILAAGTTCAVVQFSQRTYRFEGCATGDGFCHALNGTHSNLLFDGNQARIVIEDPTAGFVDINGSQNVYFRSFSIVHDPYPYTQGRIVDAAVGEPDEWIEVEVDTLGSFRGFDDPAYDADGQGGSDLLATSNRTWGNVFTPTGEMLTGVLKHAYKMGAGAERVGETADTEIWRIRPQWNGDFAAFTSAYQAWGSELHWVTVAKTGRACFRVRKTPPSSRVVYDKLTLKTCPVQGFGMFDNEGSIELLRSRVRRPVDGLISLNGGVVLDHRHRAQLRMVRNRFEGVADDGVNIFSPERPILRDASGDPRIDCGTEKVWIHDLLGNGDVRVDDVVQLAANQANDNPGHQYRGSLLARGVVTEVTPTANGIEVGISPGFWPQICQAGAFAFADDFAAFSLFNETDGAPHSRVLHNTFELRGTGVHNIGVNAVIRGNTFTRGINAISVGAQLRYENATWASDPRVGPGPYPRNLIIDDNSFDGAGFGAPPAPPISPTKPSTVQLFLPACRAGTAASGICNAPVQVEITHNQFFGGEISSVQVYGGEVEITDNSFEGSGPQGYFPVNITNAAVTYTDNVEQGVASSSCHVDLPVYTTSSINGGTVQQDCQW